MASFNSVPPDLRPRIKPKNYTYNSGGFLGIPKKKVAPTAPAAPTDGYPAFNDPYAGLLTKLASVRDLALSGLGTDLESRFKNVQSAVDASRAPLNANYSQAIQEAAAVNDAVANRLNSQGTAATADLHSQLAALGQDPTAATADLSKYYSGIGGANYAMDAGDIQRLIGRKAEENTLLNKQPELIRSQMESDLANNQGSIISDYLDKAMTIGGQSADAKLQYDTNKFKAKTDAAAAAEATYWDNYNKKQDLLFKRWQTNIASGDKKAANQTKADIAAAQRQSQIDIANIRATATTDAAQTRAAASRANAATATAAKKAAAAATTKKQTSNVNKQRAYQAALNAVIDPKTKFLVKAINPTGYNSDWTMTRIINNTLKAFGINPQSPQGRSVIASVMSQASGHKFSADPTFKYHYDPNWAKGAKKAAKKKGKIG